MMPAISALCLPAALQALYIFCSSLCGGLVVKVIVFRFCLQERILDYVGFRVGQEDIVGGDVGLYLRLDQRTEFCFYVSLPVISV